MSPIAARVGYGLHTRTWSKSERGAGNRVNCGRFARRISFWGLLQESPVVFNADESPIAFGHGIFGHPSWVSFASDTQNGGVR